MGVFADIVGAIFGPRPQATQRATVASAPGTGAATATPASASGAISRAEVEAHIARIKGAEDYNWRESIVDLLKLLELDSAFSARKELAAELGHMGVYSGSAEENKWLHAAVMQKLAETGGKVPDSFKD